MDWVRLAACCVLAVLAWSDLRGRRLPNLAVALFAALYFIGAVLARGPQGGLAAHVLTGAVALVAGALMFRFGWLGGGDAKLAAAIFLWSGPVHAGQTFFIVSVAGLILGLIVIAAGRLARRRVRLQQRLQWLAPARGVPYGIALAAGGLFAVWPPGTSPSAAAAAATLPAVYALAHAARLL